MKHLKREAKIIIYRLAKKMNQTIKQLHSCVEYRSPTEKERYSDKHTLLRLKKKGLVAMSKYPDGNIYYLTDDGEKLAKPIVDEIDEFKRW